MSHRHSLISRDAIEYAMWIVFKEDGSARMVRGMPSIDRGERAMSLSITVPKKIFRTPQLSARISIADPGEHTPQIDIEAASAALREVVGCDVEIAITTPKTE